MAEEKGPALSQLSPRAEGGSAHEALARKLSEGRSSKYTKFVIAALSSLPWIGAVIGAAATLKSEHEREGANELHVLWLEEHKAKVEELGETLGDIFSRLENFGEEARERIESPEYLALVKKAFRVWDHSDTNEKKQMLKKLITNAGAIKLCPDDLIRLFIAWIEMYHESHFTVIKEIYKHPASTRAEIWEHIHGQRVREDSSDADLYRYLIRELSTGGVIRQQRETDYEGHFLRKDTKGQPRKPIGRTMESAFEGTKPYVLTELGKKFVHYVMEDVVAQLGAENPPGWPADS